MWSVVVSVQYNWEVSYHFFLYGKLSFKINSVSGYGELQVKYRKRAMFEQRVFSYWRNK